MDQLGYKIKKGVFYKSDTSDFNYSDGDAFENELLNLISSTDNLSLFSPELTKAIKDWPSSCHLSPVRANLLRPIAQLFTGRTLELGSGCGIITRYLGELGGDVIALEASNIRAQITRARTKDLDNVTVVNDRIETFLSTGKFDAVTMIGVLQYSRLFSHFQEDAEDKLLQSAIQHLDKDGVLVIAIQNKLGLKYFAGCPEANTGTPYFGIEQRYNNKSIIRFDLEEIKAKLAKLGLKHQNIYFPFPDYHMPVSIFREESMKGQKDFSPLDMIMASAFRDKVRPDWVHPNFMLETAWETIFKSRITSYFSNAFLILASKTDKKLAPLRQQKTLGWHFSADRPPCYALQKEFNLTEQGKIIVHSLKLTNEITDNPLIFHAVEDTHYIRGRLYWVSFVKLVTKPNWSAFDLVDWVRKWLLFICKEAGMPDVHKVDLQEQYVEGSFYDCTPFNCIMDEDGNLNFIDQEWILKDNIKLVHLLINGLIACFTNLTKIYPPNFQGGLIDLIVFVFKELGIVITRDIIEEALVWSLRTQFIIHNKDLSILNSFSIKAYLNNLEEIYLSSSETISYEYNKVLQDNKNMMIELQKCHAELDQKQAQLNNYLINPIVKPFARKLIKGIRTTRNIIINKKAI